MIVRSESVLALLPPALALSWVVADAVTGLVSADREVSVPPPAVQIIGNLDASSAVDTKRVQTPVVVCSPDNAIAAGNAQSRLHGLPQVSLQRLCQAGLKFTTSLPKS